jgi:predicted porin
MRARPDMTDAAGARPVRWKRACRDRGARWLPLVAAMLVFPATANIARAQVSAAQLYGSVNVDMEWVNGKIAAPVTQPVTCTNVSTCITTNPTVFRVSANSSRLGLRGFEPLGDGNTAIFQLESSLFVDSGGATLADRDSFVGLAGAWGSMKMGRFLSPYDDVLPIFGNVPTLTTTILSTAALWAQGFAGQPEFGGFDDRIRNSVRYDSPRLSGFTGSVQYGASETSSHGGVLSIGGLYSNGSVDLGAAYERHQRVRAPNLNDDGLSLAGAYNFGQIRIGGVYEHLKYQTETGDLERDFWGVGVTANLGPGVLYAFYGEASRGKGSACDINAPDCLTRIAGLARGEGTDARQWEASYTYPFSARTFGYAGYVKIDNGSNASYTFNINRYNTIVGGKPGGLVVGIVHFF